MKIALKAATVLILLLILVSAAGWFLLDATVQRTFERRASAQLGVKVEIDQADLAVLDGELTLAGLQIQNPDGYQGRLFEMNGARTAMRPATLLKDEIVIDSLVIDSPSLHIEHSLEGTNLAKILGRFEQIEPQPGGTRNQKTYRIKQLEINGAQVTMNSSPAAKSPVVVSLPDIQMENVSSSDGAGLTLAQVFEKIFIKMTATAFRTGKTEIPPEMLLTFSSDLSRFAPELEIGIPEKAKGILEKAGGILKGLFKEGKEKTAE
jgi:uncharacterized protein involved in outer membrane biogenesis